MAQGNGPRDPEAWEDPFESTSNSGNGAARVSPNGGGTPQSGEPQRSRQGNGQPSHLEYPEGELREHEPHFRLVPFNDIKLRTAPNYLVKGLVPREGLVVIWGPPKCGKTFWAYDLAMHVALGWRYRGRKVQQGPVVYVACEGERGLAARAEAWRQQHLAEEQDEHIPFYQVTTRLDLVADQDALIQCIRRQIGTVDPALITIDTLNRSIRGSESRDEDMGDYVKAVDAVREAFACTIAVVHHCGVEANRPRGHTSLTGAADAQIAVRKDAGGTITSELEFMKDGADGERVYSSLRVIEVAEDDDGDWITSCVLGPAEAPAQAGGQDKLPKNQQTMLDVLNDAGEDGLSLEEWNDRAREAGLGLNRKADLTDYRTALKRKKLIHTYDDRWYVTHA